MATAMDAHATVTVKQHGFHVKQPLQAAFVEAATATGGFGAELSLDLGPLPSPPPCSSPYRREDGGARGLLSFAPPCAAVPQLAAAGDVAAAACLEPAEHAHLTPGVKRMMKGVVRGLKALQVGRLVAALACAA
jgi:hypothetical protein